MSNSAQTQPVSRASRLEASLTLANLQKEADWKTSLLQHGGGFIRGAGRMLMDPVRALVRKFRPEAFGPKPTWFMPSTNAELAGQLAGVGGIGSALGLGAGRIAESIDKNYEPDPENGWKLRPRHAPKVVIENTPRHPENRFDVMPRQRPIPWDNSHDNRRRLLGEESEGNPLRGGAPFQMDDMTM
ncbi:MAG: hypothetical protein E6R03_11510 [Hyphomicrobiaceae bacterium]|nr:MAG: hypothetical protein E6R03_11510 [Hyphomicrobiaceae bacterium]